MLQRERLYHGRKQPGHMLKLRLLPVLSSFTCGVVVVKPPYTVNTKVECESNIHRQSRPKHPNVSDQLDIIRED